MGIWFLFVSFPSLWHLSQLLHMMWESLKSDGCFLRGKVASTGSFTAAKPTFGTRMPFLQHSDPHFATVKWQRSIKTPNFAAKAQFRRVFQSCETAANVKTSNFAAKAPFRRVFRSCKTTFWHTSTIWKPRTLILKLRNGLRNHL